MAIHHHQIDQGSDEWLELRKDLYSGSGADKLLKHGGSMKIVDGAVSAYALNEITGFAGNFFTRRGHYLEDEAIDLYQKITGRVGIRFDNGDRVGFVTNDRFPTCGYSPDDLYNDRTIECKAFNKQKHMQMYNGDIPIKVLAQCHFGMLICGVRRCDLLIYNPEFAKKTLEDGSDNHDYNPKFAFKIIPIKWDPSIARNFRNKLEPKSVSA